jgi:hypothetical protein
MSAAEKVFLDPPADQPQWVPLVQAVLNSQVLMEDVVVQASKQPILPQSDASNRGILPFD